MKSQLEQKIKCAYNLNIQFDGWSKILNEYIINFLITIPKPIFIEFKNTEENRHTSNYLEQIIDELLQKYGPSKNF